MFKNKEELKKCIEELERLIQETDDEIAKSYAMSESEFMIEPLKSQFINELNLKKAQLDTNKLMLSHFKKLAGE